MHDLYQKLGTEVVEGRFFLGSPGEVEFLRPASVLGVDLSMSSSRAPSLPSGVQAFEVSVVSISKSSRPHQRSAWLVTWEGLSVVLDSDLGSATEAWMKDRLSPWGGENLGSALKGILARSVERELAGKSSPRDPVAVLQASIRWRGARLTGRIDSISPAIDAVLRDESTVRWSEMDLKVSTDAGPSIVTFDSSGIRKVSLPAGKRGGLPVDRVHRRLREVRSVLTRLQEEIDSIESDTI